jgi:sugar-phosphatase
LKIKAEYILFDLDGTLVDSTESINECWCEWSRSNGLDAKLVSEYSIGRTAIDTISHFLGEDARCIEMVRRFTNREIELAKHAKPLPFAKDFVNSLPLKQWAIVTSATKALAEARLSSAGLPIPRVLVTAESVKFGKPNPECYLLAAKLLQTSTKSCLVFEDAPSGVAAAQSAGMVTVLVGKNQHVGLNLVSRISDYSNVICVSTSIGFEIKL